MGYAKIDTKQGTAHSTDPASNRTYDPYKRFADPTPPSGLLLRPPDAAGPPDDPYLAAIADLAGSVRANSRTVRLLAAPWLVMPPDGESFHKAFGVALPAISGPPAVFTAVVTIVVPPGRNGVLNKIANTFIGGGFQDFSGNVIWQIQRNPDSGGVITAAERNYEKIVASLGNTLAPTPINPIRIFENDTLVLAVSNAAVVVAGQTIGGLLGGYFYPRTWDDQWEKRDQMMAW